MFGITIEIPFLIWYVYFHFIVFMIHEYFTFLFSYISYIFLQVLWLWLKCSESFSLPQTCVNIYLFFLLIFLDFILCPPFNYSIWNIFGYMDWGKVLILNHFQPVVLILFLNNPFLPYWMFWNVFNIWCILALTYCCSGISFSVPSIYIFILYSNTIYIGVTFML